MLHQKNLNNENFYLNKLLKYYFLEDINFKNYKNNIIKVLNYCKKNFNILTYNKFFYIFKNINLNDLNKIIFIIKSLNIKIIEKLPYNEILLNNEFNYNHYKNYINEENREFKVLKKNNIIIKYYKNINKNLNKISKKFIKNIFLVGEIFKLKKNNKLKKITCKIENIESNLIFLKPFHSKNNKNKKNPSFVNERFFKSKTLLKIKKIFKILSFLTFNLNNFKLKKNHYEKFIILKFLKKKFIKFKINLEMIDDFYYLLNKKIKILFKIKSIIYDGVCNLINLTDLEFNFYFLKYGSNLDWIKNIVDFKYFDTNFKNNFLKFLKKNSKKIKNLEKKYFIKSKSLIKILNYIETKKLKIDIIRNKIIKLKLNIVNRVTKKYKRNNFYNDCVQEGNLALIKSVNSYKLDLKFGFEEFLEYNIKKFINNFMYNTNRIIKIPPHISKILKEINFFCKEYKKKYNIEPSTNCVSENLNIDKIKMKKILYYSKIPVSMNKIMDGEENKEYFEYINNNNNQDFEKDIFYIILKNKLSKIIKKEKNKNYPDFINMKYGLNDFKKYKLKEIGKIYNISRDKTNIMQKIILKKIKKYFF